MKRLVISISILVSLPGYIISHNISYTVLALLHHFLPNLV